MANGIILFRWFLYNKQTGAARLDWTRYYSLSGRASDKHNSQREEGEAQKDREREVVKEMKEYRTEYSNRIQDITEYKKL